MTRDQTRALLALAAATTRDWAPGAIDVDAWHALLDDLEFEDCRTALLDHCRRTHHRPVPADVRAGVRRVRADRLERAPYQVPAGDPDDVDGYLRALRAGTARAAGDPQPRDLRQLEQVFPRVPPGQGAPPAGIRAQVRALGPGRARQDLTHDQAVADMDRLLAQQAHRDLDRPAPIDPDRQETTP